MASRQGEGRPYTNVSFQKKLDEFENFIKGITEQTGLTSLEEKRQWIVENLQFDKFCEKILTLFGRDVQKKDLKSIYRKISTNPSARVDWSELFGFDTSASQGEATVGEEVEVFLISGRRKVGEASGDRARRDVIQGVKFCPPLDAYICCSQKGSISVWSSKLKLQTCIDIHESAWSTGCDYLPGLRRVVCCTERSIALWDNRANGTAQCLMTIKPIEDSPQCVSAIPAPPGLAGDCVLFGDDQGYVNLLTVHVQDLAVKHSKRDTRPTAEGQGHIIDPDKLTQPIIRRKLHSSAVIQVKYFPKLKCFASCSQSSRSSFLLEKVDRIFFSKDEPKVASIRNGVNCFDYCARANIIATGGIDKILRLWHPHIYSRPSGRLIGHLFTIVDIAINETDQHIISLSTARVFRVWDIHTLTCLQVFTDNEDRPGDRRIYAMAYDNKHERLLTGSCVLDCWPLARTVKEIGPVPVSHDKPVVQMLFNQAFHQVVSVCTQPVIKVWDAETGQIVYSIPEAHGPNVDVTALALDRSGYKLVTGASDGSIKVWNFGAGQMIKSMASPLSSFHPDRGVNALVCIRSRSDNLILVHTVNKKLVIYLDARDSSRLVQLMELTGRWRLAKSSRTAVSTDSQVAANRSGKHLTLRRSFHRTDPLPSIGGAKRPDDLEVTCMTCISPTEVATGTVSGAIIIWSTHKMAAVKIFTPPTDDVTDETVAAKKKVTQVIALSYSLAQVSKQRNPKDKKNSTGDDVTDGSQQLEPEAVPGVEGDDGSRLLVAGDNQDGGDVLDLPVDSSISIQVDAPEDDVMNTAPAQSEFTSADEPKEAGPADDDSLGEPAECEQNVILVSAHQDSVVRFWDLNGAILREISPATPKPGLPVTSICCQVKAGLLVAGDTKGYISVWKIRKFLAEPHKKDENHIKQIVFWRAHGSKIVSVAMDTSTQLVYSASSDTSIRVWSVVSGNFIGYFGQSKAVNHSSIEEIDSSASLPVDIVERPVTQMRKEVTSEPVKSSPKFEYPLIFVQEKWQPFRRSANQRSQADDSKKFFSALMKPRAYNTHLDSSRSADMSSGAVFRALPVYRVVTPKKLLPLSRDHMKKSFVGTSMP
ncbi:WD repeat-containing protein 64-like isoform X2 [Physella acuta]|uniref:WD repeat-containing protein 64-like isoform X2 n=1 Tax=Physella acuta TaxID=109671 RepID=UPI0027DBCC3D|nr:WD repeat-containing protein 64-like isoform X2 [Physella acuta]